MDKDIVKVLTTPKGTHYALFIDGSIKVSTANCAPEKVCVWFPLGKRSSKLIRAVYFA